jgi:hypothetical protein
MPQPEPKPDASPHFSVSSKGRLTTHDLDRFPGETLFARIARAVCEAGCLPRKELFESWEVARRVRRLFRGGRVIDIGGGHGLLAQIMLLLDDSSPSAVVIDRVIPASAQTIHAALARSWPRLAAPGRLEFIETSFDTLALLPTDIVVSSHACGALTDSILTAATTARARVAVLPCCHDADTCDAGPLGGWLDVPLSIDVMRAVTLHQRGYRVWTQHIPPDITPKNRLLIAAPAIDPRAIDPSR